MKILIISGFLGAGKTTFIKKMAERTGKQFVIMENEFASLNIDAEILRTNPSAQQMKVWELTEGCICCSLNLDFAHSVMTVANSIDPEYLIVEPSGVAWPSRIVEQLNKIAYERIGLLAPITIVDALHYEKSRKEYDELFKNQLYTAGTVVLSKSEKFAADDFQRVKENLSLGTNTAFPLTHYDSWQENEWLALLNKELIVETDNVDKPAFKFLQQELPQSEVWENISLENIGIDNPGELATVLEFLVHGYGGRVARAKGHFKAGGFGIRFDLVEGDYAITGCEPPQENQAVVIGRGLRKSVIEQFFKLPKRRLKLSKGKIKKPVTV
ncbi:MAG: GTP-binding protein [Acidaminococcaceae bacterium]|nr:GTP-binding protein [Acidaminococcaceae bacterium]